MIRFVIVHIDEKTYLVDSHKGMDPVCQGEVDKLKQLQTMLNQKSLFGMPRGILMRNIRSLYKCFSDVVDCKDWEALNKAMVEVEHHIRGYYGTI